MIVPQEIRNREFKRCFNGYDEEEVASFLQELAEEFEELYSEKERLKDHLRQVRNQIEVFRKSEKEFDQILGLAYQKSADLEKQAERENQSLLDEAYRQVNQTLDSYQELIDRLNAISSEVKILLRENRSFYEEAAGLPVAADEEGVDLAGEAGRAAAQGKELLKSLEECEAFIGEYTPAEPGGITVQSLMSSWEGETAELRPGDQDPMPAAFKEIKAERWEEEFSRPTAGAVPQPEGESMAGSDEAAGAEPADVEQGAGASGGEASHTTTIGAATRQIEAETAARSDLDSRMESAGREERGWEIPSVIEQTPPSLEIPWQMPRVGRRRKKISGQFSYLFLLVLVVILGLIGGYCWRHGLIPHLPWSEAGGVARNPAAENGVPSETVGDDGGSGAVLLPAVMDQDPEEIRELLAAGVSPDVTNQNGETPLMAAAYLGDAEITRLLLEAGADPDKKERQWGNTALMYAAFRGHLEVVEMLLDNQANPDISNREGWTALMCAAYAGRPKTAQALIKGGADPDKKTNDGWTAYELALAAERELTMKAMKSEGVKPTTRDISGREPDVNQDMLKLIEN